MGIGRKLRRRLSKITREIQRVADQITNRDGSNVTNPEAPNRDPTNDVMAQALRNLLDRDTLTRLEQTANLAAEVDRLTQQLMTQVAEIVGGEKAASIIADLNYLIRIPADPALAAALISSVSKFVETGDLRYLNPLSILAQRELDATYRRLLRLAQPIPLPVQNALPEPVRRIAATSLCILEAQIPGEIHYPAFAIHLGQRPAICILDIIVFRTLPGHESIDDLFLWTHELYHVHQYRALGLATFSMKYISEQLKGGAHSFEIAADVFACSHYPEGTPSYLPGNICPLETRASPVDHELADIGDESPEDDTPIEEWFAQK